MATVAEDAGLTPGVAITLPPAIRLPAATTIDVGWSWRPGGPHRPWHLRLTVENLFDARVVTLNAGGSIDLGAPRSVMLALAYRSR